MNGSGVLAGRISGGIDTAVAAVAAAVAVVSAARNLVAITVTPRGIDTTNPDATREQNKQKRAAGIALAKRQLSRIRCPGAADIEVKREQSHRSTPASKTSTEIHVELLHVK